MSEKIKEQHLGRKALLYVRQSSQQQVLHNEESRRLQYAMQDRLRALGWTQIEVIDEDLGLSAGGLVERSGFQRMVAEVSLGRVGAVAAREVSRFARNSRDWQQLVEICRVVDSLLIDHETVYDARRGNDRLLLGLKGTLNEYELDLLRLRADEAKRAKALRGELVQRPAAGYRWSSDDRIEKDPDLRVQRTIELVFAKCKELGSARQTMMWFREHGLEMPVSGQGRGDAGVVWKKGRYSQFIRVLRNPVYAGTYAWGKTTTTVHVSDGETRSVRRRRKQEEWSVLIPNHHEGFVGQQEFDEIQKMLDDNAPPTASQPGAPKTGRGLLAGLIRCRRCGRKLQVSYNGRHHPSSYRYACVRGKFDHGEVPCIGFNGADVDDAVGREILEVIRPGAIEASLSASGEQRLAQGTLLGALRTELQAARYSADRAAKQFDGVDPQNRLVADELERRWNSALERVREIEEPISREEEARSALRSPEPERFANLSCDVERVWTAPESDMRLKKRIARTLIEEIVADVDAAAATIVLIVHWKGGVHTELVVRKRAWGSTRTQTPGNIVEAVRILARVANDDCITQALSRSGQRTAHGLKWTRQRVASLRHDHGIERFSDERKEREGWMMLCEAARLLNVGDATLRHAIERGVVKGIQPLVNGPWILKKDDLAGVEPRIRLRASRSHGGEGDGAPPSKQLPLEIPKT